MRSLAALNMPDAVMKVKAPDSWKIPQRIAYVVSHSLPNSSDGYAVRTHDVACALVENGHEVIIFNRPGSPWDASSSINFPKIKVDQKVNGVRYIYLPFSRQIAYKDNYLRLIEDSLLEAFKVFRPAIILAASNWENASPAQKAAKRFGSPFFYEQRGFWGLSLPDGPERERHILNETKVAQSAEAVFTLNGVMREVLEARGVAASKIHLVPNGLTATYGMKPDFTRQSIDCTAQYLFGYIGSLSPYEAVEDLLHLVVKLRGKGLDVAAMVVGSDSAKGAIDSVEALQGPKLKALARELSIEKFIHILPRVPAKEVANYYNIVDAIISPRHKTDVTEIVPALKPYTAAAYHVPVFLSDIRPHCEIADEIGATLFPVGDVDALANILAKALSGGTLQPATSVDEGVLAWTHRVQPMSQLFQIVSAAAEKDFKQVWSDVSNQKEHHGLKETPRRFNTAALPQVGLKALAGDMTVACLGYDDAKANKAFTYLTRQNILGVLATYQPGVFMIDWVGLQQVVGEWDDLWGISNMRLNRLVMDACRIGLDRGWDMRVVGPVSRSKAPLFCTVSSVLAEIEPHIMHEILEDAR